MAEDEKARKAQNLLGESDSPVSFGNLFWLCRFPGSQHRIPVAVNNPLRRIERVLPINHLKAFSMNRN